jgi:probable rRNA maturation factor
LLDTIDVIETVNRQRKIIISQEVFEDFSVALDRVVPEADGGSAAVAFVSDRKMRQLNKQFRGVDSTTDVLSFPFAVQSASFSSSAVDTERAEARTLNGDFLGDIAISVEQAERQAKENKLTLENEIKQLMLHGFLHLCGYDHETDDGEMNARELELREKLKI